MSGRAILGCWAVFFCLRAVGMPGYGWAQAAEHGGGHAPGAHERLGTVSFSTSCAGEVQPQFNRAVALMHSFQFASAIDAFHGVLAIDPSCSMAYWGIALSDWGNPFGSGSKLDGQLDAGRKAVEAGRLLQAKTERERSYLEAVACLYPKGGCLNPEGRTGAAGSEIDQRARKLSYEAAMDAVSRANPEDVEAAIFDALAIAAAADPGDKSYARQLKAGAILERLYGRYPDHPGLAHYIIHTYDVPALASRAAGAAEHYGEIAPSTPHALHMPSHTFTRVGDWQASIDTNIASAAAARSAGQPADELHASDYMVYAYLQTAQDEAAKRMVDLAGGAFLRFDPKMLVGGAAGASAAYFAHAAIPARYALERRAWGEAAKLEVVSTDYPYTDAMTYFARGLGAAHLKDAAGAHAAVESAIASLGECRDRLTAKKEDYWANQVEIQRRELEAWRQFSEGQTEKAAAEMRAAAEMEDRTEKSVVTPGPLAPARELLGDLLVEMKRPGEALKEYEATLVKEPNRFWSLYGAGRAARLAGDEGSAKRYEAMLVGVAGRGDRPGRRELVEVRRGI